MNTQQFIKTQWEQLSLVGDWRLPLFRGSKALEIICRCLSVSRYGFYSRENKDFSGVNFYFYPKDLGLKIKEIPERFLYTTSAYEWGNKPYVKLDRTFCLTTTSINPQFTIWEKLKDEFKEYSGESSTSQKIWFEIPPHIATCLEQIVLLYFTMCMNEFLKEKQDALTTLQVSENKIIEVIASITGTMI